MEIKIHSPRYGDFFAQCDEEDRELIMQFKWGIRKSKKTFYAYAYVPKHKREEYGGKVISMHRLVLGQKEGYVIDHINTNGLNNSRSNLRFANDSQSGANRNLYSRSSTKFKGVSLNKKKGLYWAYIRVNNKFISGGQYKNILLAASKYNELAIKYFGEFANLNEFTEEEIIEINNPPIEYRRINRNNKTGFIGVSLEKKTGKYFSTIYLNGKNKHLGSFDDPKMAAIAYNNAVMQYKNYPFTLNNV